MMDKCTLNSGLCSRCVNPPSAAPLEFWLGLSALLWGCEEQLEWNSSVLMVWFGLIWFGSGFTSHLLWKVEVQGSKALPSIISSLGRGAAPLLLSQSRAHQPGLGHSQGSASLGKNSSYPGVLPRLSLSLEPPAMRGICSLSCSSEPLFPSGVGNGHI